METSNGFQKRNAQFSLRRQFALRFIYHYCFLRRPLECTVSLNKDLLSSFSAAGSFQWRLLSPALQLCCFLPLSENNLNNIQLCSKSECPNNLNSVMSHESNRNEKRHHRCITFRKVKTKLDGQGCCKVGLFQSLAPSSMLKNPSLWFLVSSLEQLKLGSEMALSDKWCW